VNEGFAKVLGWLVEELEVSVFKVEPVLTVRSKVEPERLAVTGRVEFPVIAFTREVATVAAVEFCP
jgi:hypothetical protein